MTRKLISILLTILLCIGMLPTAVLAEGTGCTCDAVCTPAESICELCKGEGVCGWTAPAETTPPPKAPEEIKTDLPDAEPTTPADVTVSPETSGTPEVTTSPETSASPEVTTPPEVSPPSESTSPTPVITCGHGVEGECAVCSLEALIAKLPTFDAFIKLEGDAYTAAIGDIQLAQETYYNVLNDEQRTKVSNADVLLTLLNSYSTDADAKEEGPATSGTFMNQEQDVTYSWSIDSDGKLTISGDGDGNMTYQGNFPWYDARELITSVGFAGDHKVLVIGSNAFAWLEKLETITIPDTVTELGSGVFNHTGLTEIYVPDSVETMGAFCFARNEYLQKVRLPAGTTLLAGSIFSQDPALTTIENLDKVTTVEGWAFGDCTSLEEISLPEVTKVGEQLFSFCSKLTTVSMPKLQEIPFATFRGCEKLTSVTLGSGITAIGSEAFFRCSALDYTIPDTVTSIGEKAFSGCNKITTLTLPKHLTEISPQAFADCQGLTTVVIPDTVTSIGTYAFAWNSKLTTVTFNWTAPAIAADAFSGSAAFTVNYPAGDDSWNSVIGKTYGAENITWNPVTQPGMGGEVGSSISWTLSNSGVLTVTGSGALEASAAPWAEKAHLITSLRMDAGITAIGSKMFADTTRLQSVFFGGTKSAWEALTGRPTGDNLVVHYNTNTPNDHFTAGTPVPADCGTQGYTPYTCPCGHMEKREVVNATGSHAAYDNGFCKSCGAYEEPAYNASTRTYSIANAGQLYRFAEIINGTSGYGPNSAINGELTADIDLNPGKTITAASSDVRVWTPIGNGTWDTMAVPHYLGSFSGNGHSVSGVYISGGSMQGLFGMISNDSVVQGITLKNSYIKGDTAVGGIVGNGMATPEDYSEIKNCHTEASVTVEGNENVGGIVGDGMTHIANCHNRATVKGNMSVGGIVGVSGGDIDSSGGSVSNSHNFGSVTGQHMVGGIVGQMWTGKLSNNNNKGAIVGAAFVGGIAGDFSYATGSNDVNHGSVTGAGGNVGGIVGSNNGGSSISHGVNHGKVTSDGDLVGGIAGANYSKITKAVNKGKISGADQVGGITGFTFFANARSAMTIAETGSEAGGVEGTVNTGMVTGSGKAVGAVSGGTDAGTVTANSYYLNNMTTAIGEQGGTAELVEDATAAQLASGEICWLLNNGVTNGTQSWYQTLGTDDVPGFSGGTVYKGYRCDTLTYSNSPLSETPEDHVYTYTGKDAVITEACASCGHTATVTLVHDSAKQVVTANCSDNWKGGSVSVTFTRNGQPATDLTRAGSYTATATVKGAKAALDFMVTVTESEADVPASKPADAVIDLTKVSITGLDGEAAAQAEEGKKVVVTATVAYPTGHADASKLGDMEQLMEITLTKSVDGVDSPITEAATVQGYAVPFDAANKINIAVSRVHKGAVQTFTRVYTTNNPVDRTFYVDTAAKQLIIFTSRYSLYGIGYDTTAQITYMNGDDVLTTGTYIVGTGTALPTPKVAGYTFDGWYTDKALKNEKTAITAADTGDFVLYSKWIGNTYTVKFNANGGTGEADALKDRTVTFGSPYGKLPVVTKSGLHFAGWYSDAKLTQRVKDTTEVFVAADHTLYAKWSTYPVTGDDSGTDLVLYGAGLAVSLAAIAGLLVYKKRKM